MVVPMVKWGTIFNAISATETRQLPDTPLDQPGFARAISLEINGGSTPNWALDIQGKESPDATWHNITYFRKDTGTPTAISVSQLTVNWSTAQYYVVPDPPPFTRLVATRTGGTLTIYASFNSNPLSAVETVTNSGDTVTADQGTKTATATNAWLMQGGTAADLPLVNAPVTVGGRGSSTTPSAVTAADVVNDWRTLEGAVVIGAGGGPSGGGSGPIVHGSANAGSTANGQMNVLPAVKRLSDGSVSQVRDMQGGSGVTGVSIAAHGLYLSNGSTFDIEQGNIAGTLLASAARTTTTSSADQTNYNGQAVAVTINMTAVPGIETVTPAIEAKDPISGVYTAILTGTAIVATSTVRLRVGTDIAAAANLAAADVLGRTWRVTMTHSASGSFTYSVAYDLMTA